MCKSAADVQRYVHCKHAGRGGLALYRHVESLPRKIHLSAADQNGRRGLQSERRTGWLASTRASLLFYLLLLPMIVMQWLLNAGASIINNAETLIRTGHWHDSRNIFEGHFFQNILRASGIKVSTTLINFVVCATLLLFWIEAFYRMIMIPTTP